MEIETIINEMQWVEATAKPMPNSIIDIEHEALVETGRIAADTLESFEVLESVGRVVLVKFEPTWKMDPIAPIVLQSTNAARHAARAFISLLYGHRKYSFYFTARKAAARYLSSCQWLNADELAYLEKQLQLCCVDPTRALTKKK